MEQAYPLLFLCSDAAACIAGVTLISDAGYISLGITGAYPAVTEAANLLMGRWCPPSILEAMPRPTKRRVPAGRVTAKGTRPENYKPDTKTHTGFDVQDPSPIWVPILMFSLLGLGVGLIIVNYVAVFWDTSNVVLLGGLGLILAGIISATQYR